MTLPRIDPSGLFEVAGKSAVVVGATGAFATFLTALKVAALVAIGVAAFWFGSGEFIHPGDMIQNEALFSSGRRIGHAEIPDVASGCQGL